MTVKKGSRTGGQAAIVARQKLHNSNQQIDIGSINRTAALSYNVSVGFNEKDQLQLIKKEDNDDDKKIKDYDKAKHENITIDDIINCVNVDSYNNCENTLVFYVTKNQSKEAIALRFENEQDFKRIYFTYKYFKMRNRLTKNATNHYSTDSLFVRKKSDNYNNKINNVDDYNFINKTKSEFDLQTVDNDGVTHISVQQKGLVSRFDQPLSLMGLRNDPETDGIIYADLDMPNKPEKKRLFHKKTKAPPPPPPLNKDTPKVLKGEFVRVNVERSPDVAPKNKKHNKIPDILVFRDNKTKKSTNSNLWAVSNKVNSGYESDREEWRNSRSQFSTTAFDSLARPTKMAMALTLKKPQRVDPVPQYFRLTSDQPKMTPLPFRPNNFLQRPRLPRLSPEIKRNLSTDHRKFTSLQSLEIPKKLSEPKKQDKKNYSNISTRITGLTNKLRDLSSGNTIGRFKSQDVALKPVLKNDKRPVLRTCSVEPPKKVTFSAFATVQVV